MFERFSPQARHMVVSAQEQARDLDHNYIGSEHVLLGLLSVPDSLAAESLLALGYTHENVRDTLVTIVGRGKAAPRGHIPFTPRAKKVLELSLREALALKHTYIGTEHILLGLLREGEGRAAEILARRHPLDRIREEVLSRIGSSAARQTHGADRTPAAHEVLNLAAELAGPTPIGSHHILDAILQQRNSAAAKVLADAGVDLEQLAARLGAVSVEDTADDTPARAAARQLELSVTDEAVTVVLRDPASLELGRAILELNGGPLTPQGPHLDRLGQLWAVVHDWLADTAQALAPPPDAAESSARRPGSRLRRRRAG